MTIRPHFLDIPILAGLGNIVTAMSHVTHAKIIHITIVIVIFALMIVLTYSAFSLSDVIHLAFSILKALAQL